MNKRKLSQEEKILLDAVGSGEYESTLKLSGFVRLYAIVRLAIIPVTCHSA